MTFGCTLQVTGTLPSVSARAFIASYNETSRAQHYQQYQSLLEQYFQNQIERNASQMNVNMRSKSFSMKVESNQIQFIADSKDSVKYEYGVGQTPPKRFVRPAVIDTANKISRLIISDAISLYRRNIGFGINLSQTSFGDDLSSNYFNKYSSLL